MTLLTPTPQTGQTHSNNSSRLANCLSIFDHFVQFTLKGLSILSALHDFFFSIGVFFHDHSRITGVQGKGEGISLTPPYHFQPLHRYLDMSWVITAESLPLLISNSRTRIGNLWFPSASRLPLSYAPFTSYDSFTSYDLLLKPIQ